MMLLSGPEGLAETTELTLGVLAVAQSRHCQRPAGFMGRTWPSINHDLS